MTIRPVVTVVLVTVISMSLQVPEAALSAYMVFFVTKENRVLTALTGILLIVGATIAIADAQTENKLHYTSYSKTS